MDRPPKMENPPQEYSTEQKIWFYYNQGYNNGFSAGFDKGKRNAKHKRRHQNITWVRNQSESPGGQKVVFNEKTVNTQKYNQIKTNK